MQKNIYLLAVVLLLAQIGIAQFIPGQKVLGGNIGFNNSKIVDQGNSVNTSWQTNFSFNPTFAKFTKANTLCGFGLNYGYYQQKAAIASSSQYQTSTNQTLGASAFSQRFFTLRHKLFFTINTSAVANYGFGENRNPVNTTNLGKTSGYGISINLAPGLSYRLADRWIFDAYLSNFASIGFSHNVVKMTNTPQKNTNNSFSISSSLSNTNLGNIGLGFRYLIKK